MTNATISATCPAPDTALVSWPAFWSHVRDRLREANYRTGTLHVYRQILRRFASFLQHQPPSQVSSVDVKRYLTSISSCSAYWLSCNVSVLRTAFDKVGGLGLTVGVRTPKRPDHMPEVLSPPEVGRLFDATPNLRDRLVLGLFAEGGIKVGELCALKWCDVADGGVSIRVTRASGDSRSVELPQPWAGLLSAGKATYKPEEYVVAGRRPGKPCRTRTVERIVWAAARRATIGKVVSSMTLRHTHAVACLRAGMDDRSLQVRLGHASIETTMLYRRFVPYTPRVSPLDLVPEAPELAQHSPPPPARIPGQSFISRTLDAIRSFVAPRPMPSGP